MEAPISLNSEDIRAEKVKVLKSLRQLDPQEVKQNLYVDSMMKDLLKVKSHCLSR